ncbi:hypothetical protein Mal4_51290 [Maioricimonas rarisocia]|uniref:Uncharacterized protein n=1 Tax=Maioricimonas rarisocia TaxID=2528026 RepID=A0A517ZE90_9PLAN|nr:hypothetical protein [Maioricimonas rarisocia]QDU40769.1 hypothetical protein Mal4_51290 [Maioricimonas rarisocia]
MATAEVRKQISFFLPLSDWKALRDEAARQRVPITALCRRWIDPELVRIRSSAPQSAENTSRH